MQTADARAVLDVDLQIAGDVLSIAYAVHNRSGSPLYLFNLLHDGYGPQGYRVSRDRVAIELRADSIVVAKKLVPIPDDMEVEAPNLPCMTLVAPDGRYAETLAVPLPLVPWTPYRRCRGTVARERSLVFELGYVVAGPDPRGRPDSVPTTLGPQLQFDAFTESAQQLLALGPFGRVSTLED